MNESTDPRDLPIELPPVGPDAADEPINEADLRDGTIDFDFAVRPAMGSGTPRLHKMSEPISGGSIVSWAELLRQQQRQSNEEVVLGSLPEIQIDSISDKDIVKHLERESQRADRNNKPAGDPNPPIAPPMASGGSLAAKLFQREPRMPADDWFLEMPKFDTSQQSSSIDLRTAAKASANALRDGESKSGDESDILTHALMTDDGNSAVNLGMEPRSLGPGEPSQPSARRSALAWAGECPVDWCGDTQAGRAPRRQPRPLTSWLGAAALGIAAGSGLAFGMWYGKKTRRSPFSKWRMHRPLWPPRTTFDDGRRRLEAGEPDAALAVFAELPDAPETLLGRGQALAGLCARTTIAQGFAKGAGSDCRQRPP